MYFWLNYCDENYIERIPVGVKDIDHLFNLAGEIIQADRLHLFLLFDGTRIDDNEYLESLGKRHRINRLYRGTNQKNIYFELKRYLSLKNISYPFNCCADIDYFL